MTWSLVLAAAGLLGLYLAGRQLWWGWLVGLAAQVLWVVYAVVTEQWGFILTAVAYGMVYGRNAQKWRRVQLEVDDAARRKKARSADSVG